MALQSVNPATGELIQEYREFSADETRFAVAQAHEAWFLWKETPFRERGACLVKASDLLRRHKEEFARLMAAEMGKPLRQGIAEVEKCARACDFFAAHAEGFLAREPVSTEGSDSYISFEPLGVVLAIMPWNFPFWQVFRFAAPALMAGNAALLKHASNVPGCALAIEEVFRKAGFPRALFQSLLIGGNKIGEIIDLPSIRAVTLTGSTPAGKAVAARSGAALKKTVLELGGSDPYIILADADLDAAAEICVNSRLINSGQSCIAAKRFVVERSIAHEFTDRFVANMQRKRFGDPLDEATDVGPLARHDLRDDLHQQVRQSLEGGATILCGGEIPAGPGAFYPPTVLGQVKPGIPAYDEELFGPVAAIIEATDGQDAIRIANDTVFGLGAALFTADLERAERLATQLEAGQVFVNSMVASDPRLPFGGVKQSGYGRELGSFGIREFVNIKTVSIGKSRSQPRPSGAAE